MNRNVAETFNKIKDAAKHYEYAVTAALEKYRDTMRAAEQESKAYKDEAGRIAAAKTNATMTAQNTINVAEHDFCAVVRSEADVLKDELGRHLLTAPAEKFLAALGVYHTFGIAPTKAETTALMTMAAGNSLSLRALNACLEKTGAAYRVKVPGAEDFEKDLAKLERLAEGHMVYSPQGLHTEACAVWNGTPRLVRRDDGEYIDLGYKWDSIGLISGTAAFIGSINELENMNNRWTQAVLPTVYTPESYKGHTDPKTGEKISGEQEYIEDYNATAQAGEITEDDNSRAMIAAEQAKQRAAEDARAKQVLAYYAGDARS